MFVELLAEGHNARHGVLQLLAAFLDMVENLDLLENTLIVIAFY